MLFFHYVVRKVIRRFGNNSVTILVIAFVITGSMLGISFLIGLRDAARDSLPRTNIVVTSQEARDETSSLLDPDTVRKIAVLPGIRGADTKAISPELMARSLLDSDTTGTGSEEAIVLRGIEPAAYDVHDVKIVNGRMPAPHAMELVAGVQAAKRYSGLKIGTVVKLPREDWTVVGLFTAGGSTYESELWADRARVSSPLKNEDISIVTLGTASAADAATLIDRINGSKAFDATARLERDFRAVDAGLGDITRIVAMLVLTMCLLGVFVTATNLHASLVTRMPELASLIVLGVRRGRVANLVLMESIGLSLIGAVIAIGLASLAQGRSTAALTSTAAFALHMGRVPIAFGLGLAIVIGFVGGLVPSVLARRMRLLSGLRG